MKDQDDVEAETLLSTGGSEVHQKQIPPNGSLCFALVVPQFMCISVCLHIARAERRSPGNGVEGLQK